MIDFFTKKFFYGLGFIILVMMLITFPNSNTAGAYDMQGSKVTFYGADNKTSIYDVTVPYGYSLNDLENANLLSNSFFSDYSLNSVAGYNFNNWLKFSTTFVLYPDNNLLCVNNNSGYSSNLQQRLYNITISDYYYFVVCDSDDNLSFIKCFLDVNSRSVINYEHIYYGNITSLLCQFGTSDSHFQVNIYFRSLTSTIIKYAYFVRGDFVPYFNQSYVNHLYTKSGGTISDSKNWSQSQVNSLPYKFDSINQPNADLYYVNNTYVYDINNVFNYIVKGMDSLGYWTLDNITRLYDTWSIFSNFNYDNSNILEALKSLVRLFSLFFKLIFYVIAVPFSAILDLFRIVVYILFPASSWIYLT